MRDNKPHYETLFLPIPGPAELHVRRYPGGPDAEPVLMIHGSIENGRIFYTDSGKGLAPWLAAQGYDVYVADLQGRGQSRPKISSSSKHGLKELIEDEFPALIRLIQQNHPGKAMHWVAHSWGGVELLVYLSRPTIPVDVKTLVCFGSKRRIASRHWRYYYMIPIGWNYLSSVSIRKKGYLDAVGYKLGADSITAQTFYDTDQWIRSKDWIDPKTGFNYAEALQNRPLPPMLFLAGKNDHVLGNPHDVKLLAAETGSADRYKVHILSKKSGHLHDYGHVDMLTHADAPRDVFPLVVEWMACHFDKLSAAREPQRPPQRPMKG